MTKLAKTSPPIYYLYLCYPQGAHDQLHVQPQAGGYDGLQKSTEPPPDLLLSDIGNPVLGLTYAL